MFQGSIFKGEYKLEKKMYWKLHSKLKIKCNSFNSVAFSSWTTGYFSKELLLAPQRGFRVPLGVLALFTIVKKGTQLKCTTYGYIN